MLLQAILIGLVAALGVLGDQMGSLYINRPIILAPLVGLIVGNLEQSIVIGASLELFFMGAVSVGAYIPPDTIVVVFWLQHLPYRLVEELKQL